MLSIIIPTMNEEKYLPILLDSIKKQDFKDCEIIVADAGSEDKTLEITQRYGCKIIKGGFVSTGRNNGAKAANGDVFLFLDADVVLPPYFLKNTIDQFKKNDLGIAGFRVLPSGGNLTDKIFYNILNVFSILTQKILPYSACAIMSRKDIHEKIGGFDESIVFIEDYPYAKAASRVSKYKFFWNQPFYTSVRRFEKDGRFRVYFKYILAQLYMIFFGLIKSDIFKYKFNHYNEKK
ncbi:MAG: glycosyltransferase [Patescibacteria group bacterium]